MCILVAHIGAGNQALSKKDKSLKLLTKALSTLDLLQASSILETSELTNTGYGSALNIHGKVSCDASYMTIEGDRITSLGAAYNIQRSAPILETIKSFRAIDSKYNSNRHGLTRPVVVDFEAQNDLLGNIKQESSSLITPRNRKIYNQYIDQVILSMESTGAIEQEVTDAIKQEVTDTIGLMKIDIPTIMDHSEDNGTTTIATSLGGNMFKLQGRLGCAATVGAAIWSCYRGNYQVSSMCSGNGEDIITMGLARALATRIVIDEESDETITPSESMVEICRSLAQELPLLALNNNGASILYIGAICVVHNTINNTVLLAYCHTTETFTFGYCSFKEEPEIIRSSLRTAGEFARGEVKIT